MEVEYKTRQRALILQFLSDNRERHLSVDEVFDYLRAQQSPVGKSTVYRCLDRLVSQGRARRYFLGDGARACYQYVDGQGACREHFHLKCIGCGQLSMYHASAWTRLPHMCWSTTDFRLTIQKPYCMGFAPAAPPNGRKRRDDSDRFFKAGGRFAVCGRSAGRLRGTASAA